MAKRICSVGECDGVSVTRGWCSKHYQRWRTHGDPTVVKRRSGGSRPAECGHCGGGFTSKKRSRSRGGAWTRFCSKSCARKAQLADGTHSWMKTGTWVSALSPEEKKRRRFIQGERARRKRRARLAEVESEPYTLAEIAERDGRRCGICGRKVDMDLKYPHSLSASIDHIVPLSLGGTDLRTNVRLAHLGENVARGNRCETEQMFLVG